MIHSLWSFPFTMNDIVIKSCPARIPKKAWTTFEVLDKDGNLVAKHDAKHSEKDCLLNLSNDLAPFTIKFTAHEAPKAGPADADEFPAGI